MWIGLASSLAAWLRGGAATSALAVFFACAALGQTATLLADGGWPLPADAALLAELALLGAGLAGLFALRAQRRTTEELDRAENLHWDSMELVRGLRELTAQAGANLEQKLARALELGAARFSLDYALFCRIGEGAPEILAWRAPRDGLQRADLAAALAPRLRQALLASQPLALQDSAADAPFPALTGCLAAQVRTAGGAPCVLAFAGRRSSAARFTATDKDLIGLMAEWLCGELLRRAGGETPRRGARKRAPARSTRARHDLNGAVHRVAPRLRAQVDADATLELSLAEALPALLPQRIPLEALVESLVVAAHGLGAGGSLRVETAWLAGHSEAPDASCHATLSVRVRGAAVDADALARAYAVASALESRGGSRGGALPLAQVESLLRRAGGDLSVQIEPGRGALLTAFLPGKAPSDAAPSHARAGASASQALGSR